jgi:L-lactate dehydrogenase complex protein LldG
MSSRNQILANIKANQPDLLPLPKAVSFGTTYPNLTEKFCEMLSVVGGVAVLVPDFSAIGTYLKNPANGYMGVVGVATTLPELAHLADFDLAAVSDPHELAGLNLAIIGGQLGVAENGAIWVDERNLPHRVLPMITQYLAIVIHEKNLVLTMHHAYDGRLNVAQTGFGTFIAGPSKTADIEQSLVIGAHGARGLTVFVLID